MTRKQETEYRRCVYHMNEAFSLHVQQIASMNNSLDGHIMLSLKVALKPGIRAVFQTLSPMLFSAQTACLFQNSDVVS